MKEYAQKIGEIHKIEITRAMLDGISDSKSQNDKRMKKAAEKEKMKLKEQENGEEERKKTAEKLEFISQSKKTLGDFYKHIDKKSVAKEAMDVAKGLMKYGTRKLTEAKGHS